jgi:beta-aspartyl-peptidase (threonine type)
MDSPVFDAGVGFVFNEDDELEMDSMIMEGSTLKTGAVAALRKTKNPVSLAIKNMEKIEHV